MNPRFMAIGAAWVIAIVLVIAGWASFVATGRFAEYKGGQPIFFTFAALSAPVLGSVVLRRHRGEWTGPLLSACVLTTMLAALRTADLVVMPQVMGVVAMATVLLPALVAVTHPALQAPRRVRLLIVWSWWLTAVGGLAIAVLMIATDPVPTAWWFTASPGPAGVLATTLLAGYAMTVVAAVAGASVFAVFSYRSLPLGGRNALTPLVLPLVGWSVATVAATAWAFFVGFSDPTAQFSEPGNTIFVVLPAVLVYVLVLGIGWIDVMVRRPIGSPLSAVNHPGGRRSGVSYVERFLSRALADPSIRVLYPVAPTDGGWVEEWMDGNGEIVNPDVTTPDRAVTLIRRGSTVIGMIEQDAAAATRPDAVELVATGAGLIMETERLTASARRDLEQCRLLAARLLSASDDPRAELRAQLLAGPLDDLDRAATSLTDGAAIGEIAPQLAAVSAQVRTISHGVFPHSLASGGLSAALPGTEVPDHRLPAPIEMTAYLLARADHLAVIADSVLMGAPALRITTAVDPAPTVRDRVAALDGRLEQAESRWTITLPVGD